MNKYIDSCVKWIGQIPNDWELKTINMVLEERNQKNNGYTDTMLSLSAKDGVTLYSDDNHSGNKPREDKSDYKVVEPNDIVVNSMNILSGSVGISNFRGCVSPVYYIYHIRNKDNIKFLFYLFSCKEFQSSLRGLGNGILIKETEDGKLNTIRMRIPSKKLKNELFPIPSIDEQNVITEFLDNKCDIVNNLIKNQQDEIDELIKYKESLIFQITRTGLNKSVIFKETNKDWFKRIPNHWKICKTSMIFDIYTGTTPKTDDEENYDGDIRWITPADFKTNDVYVYEGRRNISLKGFNSCSLKIIPENSIIFSKRAPIGSVAINKNELCINQGCLGCAPKNNKYNIKYYYYLMSSLTEPYELYGAGTTFKEISLGNFSQFELLLPPIEEQEEISKYLDKELIKINRILELKNEKIEELNNYKKSLIYEYVTGKKRCHI